MHNNKKTLLSYFQASHKDWQDWRWQFKNRITTASRLVALLGLSQRQADDIKKVASVYPLAVTPYYLSLIDTDNPEDPIRNQCIPHEMELDFSRYTLSDPLEEDAHMPVAHLIRRYPDRSLAMVTETCATYCRHCNRKRFWSTQARLSLKTRLLRMTQYIAASPQIREVILSGGDPLTFDNHVLEFILKAITGIPHVEVLRIGSRVPVVMPMRISRELCRMLKRYRPLWFNTQFNHPGEITPDAARACHRLQEAGIPVSNQSVLLKSVNDSQDVMLQLLNGLQRTSIRPYYLFHCEPAKGCGHFRTSVKSGLNMMENIRRLTSGLSLPQYVMDLPGNTGKVPLNVLACALKNDLRKHQHFFDKF